MDFLKPIHFLFKSIDFLIKPIDFLTKSIDFLIKYIVVLFLMAGLTSGAQKQESIAKYIDEYKELAIAEMKRTGVPAAITLAQGIHESGAGQSKLVLSSNNHFGIKCHKEWTGPSIKYTDDEENECFRKYDDPIQSFKDHSYFLTSRPRYAELFEFEKDDYRSWAYGLKAAGYATDSKYPDKLIGLIERYQLNKYDTEVLGKDFVSKKGNCAAKRGIGGHCRG